MAGDSAHPVGLRGHLGALDRWLKPLTGIHILLLLLVLALGGAAGAGYALVRSSGVVPLGEYPD